MSTGAGAPADSPPVADTLSVTIVALETPEVPGRMIFDSVPRSATVGELRVRIRHKIASNPDVQRLRLIHNGRLLSQDAMTLAQVLSSGGVQNQRGLTIHLAVRPGPESSQAPSLPAAGVSTTPGQIPGTTGTGQAPAVTIPMVGTQNAAAFHNTAMAHAMAAHQEAMRMALVNQALNSGQAGQSGQAEQAGQAGQAGQDSQAASQNLPTPNSTSRPGSQDSRAEQGAQSTHAQENGQTGDWSTAATARQDQATNALQQMLFQQIGVVNNAIHQLAQASVAVNQAARPVTSGMGLQGQAQGPMHQLPRAHLRNGGAEAAQNVGMPGQRTLPLPEFQRHVNEQHRARHEAANTAGDQASNGSGGQQSEQIQRLLLQMQRAQMEAQRAQAALQQAQQVQQAQQMRQQSGAGAQASANRPSHHAVTNVQTAQFPIFTPGQTPMQSFAGRIAAARIGGGAGPVSQATALGSTLQHVSGEYDSIYLLTSPEGNQAVLLSQPIVRRAPVDLAAAAAGAGGVPAPRAAAAADTARINPGINVNEEAPQAIGVRDLVGIVLPFGGHVWLLARLIFFTVILTWGATWRRTILVCLGVVLIFMSQTGLLGPFQAVAEQAWVPVRRHIEDLVRDVDADQPVQGGGDGAPDPRRAAQRLLRLQREQNIFRRAERSIALFVASFVPGVGEAQVAAREQATRDRRQALEAQDEAARQQREREAQEAATTAAATSTQGEGDERETADSTRAGMAPGRVSPVGDAAAASSAEPAGENRDGLRQRQPMVEEASDDDDDDA